MFEICALLILSFSSLHSRLLFLLLGDVRHSVALTAASRAFLKQQHLDSWGLLRFLPPHGGCEVSVLFVARLGTQRAALLLTLHRRTQASDPA